MAAEHGRHDLHEYPGRHERDPYAQQVAGRPEQPPIPRRIHQQPRLRHHGSGNAYRPVPANVTTNPAGQSVAAGQSVTFSAAATGNPTPTVQWQVSIDGGLTFIVITGATSPTLTLTNVTAGQNGYQYRAAFTNGLGSVMTAAALLTVF